jgi:Flp pilus assembly pilin Flp
LSRVSAASGPSPDTPSSEDVLSSEDEMNLRRGIAAGEDGQDLLEYGLLASLIAIFALATVKLLASQITSVFWGAIATKF